MKATTATMELIKEIILKDKICMQIPEIELGSCKQCLFIENKNGTGNCLINKEKDDQGIICGRNVFREIDKSKGNKKKLKI